MGLQRKAAKLTRKEDLLIQLPDEILSTIISMLTMREAVRTSVLSKRWKCIWTSHADLWFDSANVLGNTVYSASTSNCLPELDRKLQRCTFIERVNQFMHLRCKGTKVDSFVVHFHLGKDSTSHIDWWLSNAITKGVVNVDLDLSESSSFMVDPAFSTALEKYEFPCWLLTAAGKSCSLKHLRLASCSLSASSALNGLTSLVTIQLQGVTIIDQQLERLLSSCLFLEELSLRQCNDLVNLTLAGPSLRLKILNVEDCFRLQKMELCAKNLVSFEYTGHLITFYFKNVPRLSEAFLNFNGESKVDGTVYALTRFGNDLPQLETLNIVSVLAMKILELPETVPKFTNIKQLVLTVFPFEDDDKLYWISYVLEAFPSLRKLQLNLFCPAFIKPPREMKRVLPKRPHLHLNELEINGVYGSHHEVELLRYLLDNLIFLKVLVISSNQKAYRGVNNWFYEEAISWYKSRLKTLSKSLRAVVPDTVQLQIHCC